MSRRGQAKGPAGSEITELFRSDSPEKTEVETMLIEDSDEQDQGEKQADIMDDSQVQVTMPTSIAGDESNLTPIIDEGIVTENLPSTSSQGKKKEHARIDTAEESLPNNPNLLASLPVYYSTSIPSTSSLQIFQYPTYPKGAPLPVPESARSRGHRQAIRYRSKAKRVEVELPLDLRTAVYNLEKGEEMGKAASVGGQIGPINTPVKVKKEHGTDVGRAAPKRLERTRLDSTLIPSQTQYMIGVIRDKALHLTPVDTMIQLRPSMHYLDVMEAMKQQEKRRAQAEQGEDTDEGSMTEDANRAAKDKKKAQSLTVSVRESAGASGVGGRAKGGVADSRDVLMQADREAEAERWIELDWKDEKSEESKKIFDAQLFASSKTPLVCCTRPRDFLSGK